ncbi:hypothetical protein BaRGS_00021991 [Batillaria attramentaria]|uniref:Uncharacterized protein n=1 Tax=Batillaria attramentaria TaxID=370345 RepID=A0ABD0KI40_9CAEN
MLNKNTRRFMQTTSNKRHGSDHKPHADDNGTCPTLKAHRRVAAPLRASVTILLVRGGRACHDSFESYYARKINRRDAIMLTH